jgi:tetratricopeptide (TPR) repeat protein
VLAEVRRLALPLAGDPLADRALALAELQGGAPAEAGRLLDQLLTLSPRDPDLLRWRAQAAKATRSADGIEAARAYLVRAFNAAPTDWRTLHAYARLYRNPAAPLPDTVLPVLLKAYALAPQVTEVVLDTALALSNAGRMPEAAAVLEPLAFAPHGGRAAELAQRMLQKARAGDQAGLLAEISEMRRQQIGRISAVQSR